MPLLYQQGMRYIHHSGLKIHGNLKSYTCMVDSRWTVKVSFFGLCPLTHISEVHCGDDERNCSNLLWTAPELLRLDEAEAKDNTEKGDVYSFGIILQEILYRNSPFFDGDISAMGKMAFWQSRPPTGKHRHGDTSPSVLRRITPKLFKI